jgi:hypothetical protein
MVKHLFVGGKSLPLKGAYLRNPNQSFVLSNQISKEVFTCYFSCETLSSVCSCTEETKIEMDAEEFLANTVSLAGYV